LIYCLAAIFYSNNMGINSDPEVRRAYQLAWIKRRRQDWFSDKQCVDCGSKERLELDHIDPEQKVSNSIWSWSQKRRDEETAKCEVRCYCCHKSRSAKQCREWFSRPITHGTVTAYLKRKCKCSICSEFYKKWRRNKYERIGK